MIIPDKIKIGTREISVSEVTHLLDDAECFGDYDHKNGAIRIQSGLAEDMEKSVLLHEVVEGINSIYAIGLKHRQLHILAVVLHQVFTDNPGLVRPG